jgi:SAM-dependent methyltransferase
MIETARLSADRLIEIYTQTHNGPMMQDLRSNYDGLTVASAQDRPHLGGNIREGDPFTFCPRAWSYIVERFCINSVLDLGSGLGNAAEFFFRRGIRAIAIDGLIENVNASLYPTICHDLTKAPIATNVDLVHCQEVVEHIEEKYLANLLSSLSCGRVIFMTHALPGQTGFHHVNLQPMEYWVNAVTAYGYNLMAEDTNRIREIAQQEGALYVHNSGLIFHRR